MENNRIVIVDYGMGNLRSVQKAFEKVGFSAEISSDQMTIRQADKLVLPGVGAIRDAIGKIRDIGLEKPILDHLNSDRPFFGICLGLQMLFENCYEDGKHRGLGFYRGDVVKFSPVDGLKIPHMGWNSLRLHRTDPLLLGLSDEDWFYFVHGYVAPISPRHTLASTVYGQEFPSVVRQSNFWGVQFHPERSGKSGARLLSNFLKLSPCA